MDISANPRGRIFTLTLSETEAGALLKVMGRISGSPGNSPRGFCSEIYDQLTALSVKPLGECGETNLHFADGAVPEAL
jgi:hypothetical protein